MVQALISAVCTPSGRVDQPTKAPRWQARATFAVMGTPWDLPCKTQVRSDLCLAFEAGKALQKRRFVIDFQAQFVGLSQLGAGTRPGYYHTGFRRNRA